MQDKPDLSAYWLELNNRDAFFHFLSCDTVLREQGLMIDTFHGLVVFLCDWKMPLQKMMHGDLGGSPATSNKVSLGISVADV